MQYDDVRWLREVRAVGVHGLLTQPDRGAQRSLVRLFGCGRPKLDHVAGTLADGYGGVAEFTGAVAEEIQVEVAAGPAMFRGCLNQLPETRGVQGVPLLCQDLCRDR